MNGSEKGYTMVELGITMAVIGILAAIAIPSFKGVIPRFRFRSSVEMVSTEVNLTRLKAISLNREYRLRGDTTNELFLVDEGNRSAGSTAWTNKQATRLPATVDLYQVESMIGNKLLFRPDGSVDETDEAMPDGVGRFYLRGENNTLVSRINIAAHTGRVTVERLRDGVWVDERRLKE
jgi:prepilin-type N-terminal cleavage/methylation domain-containing protein